MKAELLKLYLLVLSITQVHGCQKHNVYNSYFVPGRLSYFLLLHSGTGRYIRTKLNMTQTLRTFKNRLSRE